MVKPLTVRVPMKSFSNKPKNREAALLAAAQAAEAAEAEEEEDEDVAKTSKKSTSTGGRKTDNLLDRFMKNVVGTSGS